jgi:antitoxin (DNA-binding transcriptional repressor) of toxin-antitoxin stability system
VLRRAEAGEQLTITVGGRPVAQLGPLPRRPWVKKAEYLPILLAGSRDPRFFHDLAELSGELEGPAARWERE